jgi:type II secretory pathway pseudopilin PulG
MATNTQSKRRAAAALVIILLVLVGVQTRNSRVRAKEATLKAGLFQLRDAIDEHLARTGTCPESLKALEGRQLKRIPVDPFTDSSTSWQYASSIGGRRGSCDVKSGSQSVARDGSRHADW